MMIHRMVALGSVNQARWMQTKQRGKARERRGEGRGGGVLVREARCADAVM